jgi:hypothetical protein
MPEVNYELCEQCEKNMNDALEEAGLTPQTIEEMIEAEAIIPFSFAIDLAQEGHVVKRVGDEYALTLRNVDSTGCGEETPEFCVINEEGKTISLKGSFTTEDILADYVVIK